MCRSRFTDYCCFKVAFTGAAGKKAIIRHNRNHRSKLIPRGAKSTALGNQNQCLLNRESKINKNYHPSSLLLTEHTCQRLARIRELPIAPITGPEQETAAASTTASYGSAVLAFNH
jgi:hypothetical protein